MASGRHCEECRRLTDLYLKAVGHHSRLIEESDPLQGDDEWRIAQAERSVKEVRQRFLSHRITDHSLKEPSPLKVESPVACAVCNRLEAEVLRLERQYFGNVLRQEFKSNGVARSKARLKLNGVKATLSEHKRNQHGPAEDFSK
jgi:hypothetical protein